MDTIEKRIEAFVAHADQLAKQHFAAMDYKPSLMLPPTHRADFVSSKWCKIVSIDDMGHESVYGFICLRDGATKSLGPVKVGDIHKAATWKQPAKHARGNVFSADFDNCATSFGIKYLQENSYAK